MPRILIVESETPAVIEHNGKSLAVGYAKTLRQIDRKIAIDIAAPYVRPLTADDLAAVDGVVFPGSGVSWSADAAEAEALRAAMELVFAQGLPCFGSCNGLQLAAVVLGGRVRAEQPEVGIARDIQLTEAGAAHSMMATRQPGFAAPTVHGDQVTELPRGAIHLAYNEHCAQQAFVYEDDGISFWGVEYHPELAVGDIGRYIAASPDRFADFQHLVDDLLVAEQDDAAAARLGADRAELSPPTRTTELNNWLARVAAEKATR